MTAIGQIGNGVSTIELRQGRAQSLVMCNGVSQLADARCYWMRLWRPWTTDVFNAHLSLFHRAHVCIIHRFLHCRDSRAGAACTAPSRVPRATTMGRLASISDGFNAIFSLQQKQRMWDYQREHLQHYSLSGQLLSTPTISAMALLQCRWTWRRDEQHGTLCNFESIVVGCGDPLEGYNYT